MAKKMTFRFVLKEEDQAEVNLLPNPGVEGEKVSGDQRSSRPHIYCCLFLLQTHRFQPLIVCRLANKLRPLTDA